MVLSDPFRYTVTADQMSDQEFDARGLNCPLPILRAEKALSDISNGQTLHMAATDPGSVKDFEAFAKQMGNELVESNEAGGEFSFVLKKAQGLSHRTCCCPMLQV